MQALMEAQDQDPIKVAYERRNRDLDPQLVWRGKDAQNEANFNVDAPPLFIQEKIHPKALVDDLMARSKSPEPDHEQFDLFSDFNGLPEGAESTEFYEHDSNWSNRMILGDSLQVMASLAEREALRGKVQCIYIDPPYGIKFNSNFQWSTTSRDVRDNKADHITREPEQVKAFRDTWRDGINSYLTYLRDRLTLARDLLAESGSVFVQIGDENVHRVRAVLDEVFGPENIVSQISFRTTTGRASERLAGASNYLLWFAKDIERCKYRPVFQPKAAGSSIAEAYSLIREVPGKGRRFTSEERKDPTAIPSGARVFAPDNLTSSRPAGENDVRDFVVRGAEYTPGRGTFKTDRDGLTRLDKADRIWPTGGRSIRYVRYLDDFPVIPFSNMWIDTGTGGFNDEKVYVVQTSTKVVERCMLMTTDPGDLVFDPTCGSGTTAVVAEEWGRRWITADTSRVALALARARLMGARYPYYLLSDSEAGVRKEAELSGKLTDIHKTNGDIRQGFVYERVPHVTLKAIANNAEIDVIWDKWRDELDRLRKQLNGQVGESWDDWQIPVVAEDDWSEQARESLSQWWTARVARQREIDESIGRRSEVETLFDRPFVDKGKIRVTGPFTVESVSPHRTLVVGGHDELIDPLDRLADADSAGQDFGTMVLENLRTAGVQQSSKEDRIEFSSVVPWPGNDVCAEGRYLEGADPDDPEAGRERRAAIFIGPEFGTVTRPQLVGAAREAVEAGFDVLVACAFSYDSQVSELNGMGQLQILKARMNADLHMADDLKNTGRGNLFVVFGEPDIDVMGVDDEDDSNNQIQIRINGVDIFDPATGKIRSDDTNGIACWFIDTDYNEESFFVRQAYFPGNTNDPYKALKTSLRTEIDRDAWESLNSDISRPFETPASGRIAVKVINHLGDEATKIIRVD